MKNILPKYFHVQTVGLLLAGYAAGVGAMWAVPHRLEGFGRMNAHQAYASLGRVATFGQVDRTLTDWYMLGPDWDFNVQYYDAVVWDSTVVLTPFFIFWVFAAAHLVRRFMPSQRIA